MLISENNLMMLGSGLIFLGMFIGYVFAYWQAQKTIHELNKAHTLLSATRDIEKAHHATFLQNQALQKQQLSENFRSLSGAVLKHNNETFLQLAKETLGQYQVQAKSELDKKENAFGSLIEPIKTSLEKTQQQIQLMEKDRKESYGALNKHLESMTTTQNNLYSETRNLVKAFRRPEVRGQWGELTLKRLAELAGMVEHCDFEEQVSTTDEAGTVRRPDMIVRLPNKRDIIVDSKTPLDAYLDAIEAPDEASKNLALERHLKQVKQHIKTLSSKAYWQQFEQSPDFVILFIPGDQFLNAALDRDKNLIEDALSKKIILSTPTSFVALLRAVAYGWRQETMAENAEKIQVLGEEMYARLTTFTDHLSSVGKSLDQSVSNYNKTISTLSSRVIPSVRKFQEMGIQTKKDIKEPVTLTGKTHQLDPKLID